MECGMLRLRPTLSTVFATQQRKKERKQSPKAQKNILLQNRDVHCLEDTKVTWCLSYPSGGPPHSLVGLDPDRCRPAGPDRSQGRPSGRP